MKWGGVDRLRPGSVSAVVASLIARGARLLAQALRRPRSARAPHIAIFCDWFLRYGSAQAIGLKSAGAQVTLYYADRLGEFGGRPEDRELFLDHARTAGVDIVQVPVRSIRSLGAHVRSLARDVHERGITAAIAQQHYDPRFGLVSLRLPTALLLHDPRPHSGEETTLPRRGRLMARVAEATASCIVIHSKRLEPQVPRFLTHHPLAIVPHGTRVADVPLPVPDTRELLLFGRLFPYKGIEDAIEAFELVRRTRPECCLTIAGHGPMAEALRDHLPDGVVLLDGYVTEAAFDSLLGRATLVLLPYRDATQSGVGLRAIAQGIPCIVTDEGGLPDLIPAGAQSCVVPSNNSTAFATAIVANLDHDDMLRRAVQDHAARYFDWPVVGAATLKELERVGVVAPGLTAIASRGRYEEDAGFERPR